MSIQSINPHIHSLFLDLMLVRVMMAQTPDLDPELSITELLDILDIKQQNGDWSDIYDVILHHLNDIYPFYECGFLDGSLRDGIITLNQLFRK